ncbi:carboxylesterase family protein [Glaciihabitans tibetensis]|uniref:carboxylesterase family protein n=1 Tax=Glaciihabitans tibetensis TaxID=1266600 RepID=UPI00318352AA
MTDTSARTSLPAVTRDFMAPAGRIVGFVDGDVVRVLGVPYAEAARFEPPRPVAVSTPGPFFGFHKAPASPQRSSPVLDFLVEGANDGITYSENCQALSITVPSDLEPGERLPVMVWIHGGSYVTGAGDLDIYDPRALVAEQRVIAVNVTFRLGILGWLGFGNGSAPANLGLLDIIAALRWINTNIEAFGGAADAVTLFGQSAGGDAIAHLMISEGAAGLFQRAIVQSAPLGISRGRSRMSRTMARVIGTPAPGASVDALLALQSTAERVALPFGLRGGMPFGTQYGHAPLPAERDLDAAWSKVAPAIDLMIGTTVEETGLYLGAVPALGRFVRLPGIRSSIRWMLVRPTTRLTYTRDAHRFAARHRAAGGRAAVYEVTWKPVGAPVGAVHMIEIPLLLGSRRAWQRTSLMGSTRWDEIDRRGRRVREIWADFARTGRVPSDAAAGLAGTIRFARD